MPSPTVFISYRHGDPGTKIARALHTAFSAVKNALGFKLFMDESDLEPGGLFDQDILDALASTTHFVALIDNDYWASKYCQLELNHVVSRFEKHEPVRLLFVMAGAIKPEYLTFEAARASGTISTNPIIRRIGDLQFLGPFDNGRLERLKYEATHLLGDQINQLVEQLAKVISKPAPNPKPKPTRASKPKRPRR
jgi:hypothetical protein